MPTITTYPKSGPPGTSVTCIGSGFAKKQAGAVTFGGTKVGAFRTAGNGSFSIMFSVPVVDAGIKTVLARTSTTSGQTTFTVEKISIPEPPIPEPPVPEPIPPNTNFPIPTTGIIVGASLTAAQVQALINNSPAESVFLWEDRSSVFDAFITPKSGNKHYAKTPRGAILLGGGFTGYGGETGQHDILIQGFVLENRTGRPLKCGWRWTLNDIEARNSIIGVDLNNGCRVNGGRWHHNAQYAFAGGPTTDIMIDGLEWDNNNPSGVDDGDRGGCKIVGSSQGTTFVTVQRCHVHHNGAHGIWFDWANKDILYLNNYVHDNGGCGIFHEASDRAVIRDNRVEYNMVNVDPTKSIWYGSEIYLNDSSNVEILNNYVKARTHGICGTDSDRGSGLYGELMLCNVVVHDNVIVAGSGHRLHYLTNRTNPCGGTPWKEYANS